MHANRIDDLSRKLSIVGTRRGLVRVLAEVPLVVLLTAWLVDETEAGRRSRRARRRFHRDEDKNKRRVESQAKGNKSRAKKGKKKDTPPCANAGQTPKKGKRCCLGLVKDGTGRCAQPSPPPGPSPRPCAETCAGCCIGETCDTATSPQRCGSGGVACVACAACKRCDAGQCVTDEAKNGTCCNTGVLAGVCQSGNCVSDICGPCTCPNGCCDGTICLIDDDAACGPSCDNCTLSSERCQGGQCVCAPLETCPSPQNCGDIDDGCGNRLPCGTCPMSSPICKDGNTCAPCANSAQCGPNHLCWEGSCFTCNVCDDPVACEDTVQRAINLAQVGGTVYICPGTYDEAIVIHKDLTLIGAGSGDDAEVTVLRGLVRKRVVTVSLDRLGDPVAVELHYIKITGGDAAGESASDGGGIYNQGGSLTLNNCVVSQNHASLGGGIFNTDGTVSITNSQVQNNVAAGLGGGIQNEVGTVTLDGDTSVTKNDAGIDGGGIYNESDGIVTLIDGSSVAGNTVGGNPENPNNCSGPGTYNGRDHCDP